MMDDGDRPDVLLATLDLAVPLHREELRHLPSEDLCAIANAAATVVSVHGDDLQFGGRHCAATFNALARGIAAAALNAWGGITVCGVHWCADPACHDRDAPHDMPVDPQIADPAPRDPRRPVETVTVRDGPL